MRGDGELKYHEDDKHAVKDPKTLCGRVATRCSFYSNEAN